MTDAALISFDFAIKYLLKNKSDYDIVEGFISALFATEGYNPVKITALLESESNKEADIMKRSIADLIVEDTEGQKFIIEIDRSYTNLFLQKACFNSCRLIVDNIASNQDYSTIKKVFHINLLYFPFAQMKNPLYHGKTIFHEIDQQHPQKFHLADRGMQIFDAYNVLPEYFIISVPLFDDVIRNEMDEWLYLAKHSKVRGDFKSPYMKKVAQRLSILTMTRDELANYYSYTSTSLKERDYLLAATQKGEAKGKAEGIQIGEAKGREEGREEGIQIGEAKLIKMMINNGSTIEEIAKITKLSIAKINELLQM